MIQITRKSPCPCGSGLKYKRCCLVCHQGAAKDAQALMRSRYCAYAMGLADYLIATTHPLGPHHRQNTDQWRRELIVYSQNVRFQGLDVRSHERDGHRAWVTFHAQLASESQDLSFTERSLFLLEGGAWLYHSGDPIPAPAPKQ